MSLKRMQAPIRAQAHRWLIALRGAAVTSLLFSVCVGSSQAGLTRHDVLVIANSASATSKAVANYYAATRGIPASHVRLVNSSTGDNTWPSEFVTTRDQIKNHLISLGSDPAHPETDPIKAIVLTYDIPHKVTDGGEAYSSFDSALSAIFTESSWGKEPIGVYGYYQPVPGSPNAYLGDYSAAMPFSTFRSNTAGSTYCEAFPEPGFTIVRMLDSSTALAAGGGGIIYRGVLSGGSWTWTPVAGRDRAFIGWSVSNISVRDSTHVYACTGNASRPHGGGTIIISSNGGQTWTKVRNSPRGLKWKLVQALFGVDFVDSTHGWAVGTSQVASGSATPYMIRTTDGTTWTDISSGLPSGFTPRAVAAADTNNVWICGDSGKIYRSVDAGSTWTLANTGAPSVTYTSIWIRLDSGTPKGWAAGSGGTIVRTENGTTWTQEASGLTTSDITDLSCYDQDHACAAYSATSFLTFTRGVGWSVQSTGLAPMVSAASATGSTFVSVGSTRYIFAKPASTWLCAYTGTDTPWRLRYLVTRLDGFSFDTNPADGIPDAIKGMIDRGAAASSPGKFVIDETPSAVGQFAAAYNALLPIVGSSNITYNQTSTYLTGQSNVIGYTSNGMHDPYADSYTTWGRTFNNWANGGIATVLESTDGGAFDRPRFAWGLGVGGTVYANKLSLSGFASTAPYTGFRLVLHGSNGAELASATITSGTAQIDLSSVSWPADHVSYAVVRFPNTDPLCPGQIVYDAFYPNLTGSTYIYDNRTTGVALAFSTARTLMAATIAEGASGGICNVDEPWSMYAGRPQYLFPRYAQGYTWAETAYMGIPGLGWQEVALGDPLMAPYATPPTVAFTAPAQNGFLAQGTVRFTATAIPVGASGIDKVEFWLDDDTLLATDTSSPYQIDLNTTALTEGIHIIEAIAFESGSVQNTGSATRTVMVSNGHTVYASPVDVIKLEDYAKVALQSQMVSAAFNGKFYIQDANRIRGIRVSNSAAVHDGDLVTVIGTLQPAINGEREILADSVWVGN
jgi:photosystem II stability/assembly factor-like uncharacterized protein